MENQNEKFEINLFDGNALAVKVDSFKNKKLATTTTAIVKEVNAIKTSAVKIGLLLKNVKDNNLFKEDYGTFNNYCEIVLGFGKSQRARFLLVADKLVDDKGQMPEKVKALGNTAQTVIAENIGDNKPFKDLKAAEKFIEENKIDKDTKVSDLKAVIKGENGEDKAAAVTVEDKPKEEKAIDIITKTICKQFKELDRTQQTLAYAALFDYVVRAYAQLYPDYDYKLTVSEKTSKEGKNFKVNRLDFTKASK